MADFYFGNLATGALKRPAPESGMGASNVGSEDSMTFDGGGAYVTQSAATHKEFNMSWGVQDKSAMDFLNDYRNGVYGQGLLYMIDPFAKNSLPAHWARPNLTCAGWPSLIGPAEYSELAPAAVVTNLATNPGWEQGGAPVQVRRNVVLNPRTEDTLNWLNIGVSSMTIARNADLTAFAGTGVIRATRAGATNGMGYGAMTESVNNGTYIGTVRVRGTAGITLAPYVEGSAVKTASAGSGTTTLTGNWQTVWTKITVTTAGTLKMGWLQNGTIGAIGEYVEMNGASVIQDFGGPGSPDITTYFDGTTPAAGDFSYNWVGTANASASQQTGLSLPGAVTANPTSNLAAIIQSKEWTAAGVSTASMRIIPVGTLSDTGAIVIGGSGAGQFGPMAPGKTYTATAILRLAAPITGALWRDALSLFYTDSVKGWTIGSPLKATATNTAGEQKLSLTFTVPANATWATVRLYAGALPGNGEVWFDNFMLVEGSQAPSYFDGNSRFVDGTAAAWTGTPNASTSTLARTPGNMPNTAAKYTIVSEPNAIPARMLTLLIPDNQDLYLGFSGSATNGGVVRMRTITRDGAYGLTTDLTLLDPSGNTRLNTKVSGGAYRAVQVYLTSTLTGASSVTLVSGKAVYSLPTVTPDLTGSHIEGEGHTGFRFSEAPTMTYIKAASGRSLVSSAAAFTEIEAWL